MICKICKKEMASLHIHPAGRRIAPNCICGKIRKRERAKGCSKCGAMGIEIQIYKRFYGWLARCDCGNKWRLKNEHHDDT